MVEVDASTPLIGPDGPVTLLDTFEGRRQLIAYYFMWHPGHPAAEQCEGCTWVTTQVAELSYLHSRDITFAVFCQGPYEESARYRDFMGWHMPWYSAQNSLGILLAPPKRPGMMHLVCHVRDGDRVFETYWTTIRGVEAMDNNYRSFMDLTVYGRQEPWEDSPPAGRNRGSSTRAVPSEATEFAAPPRRRGPHPDHAPSPSGRDSRPDARTTFAPPDPDWISIPPTAGTVGATLTCPLPLR